MCQIFERPVTSPFFLRRNGFSFLFPSVYIFSLEVSIESVFNTFPASELSIHNNSHLHSVFFTNFLISVHSGNHVFLHFIYSAKSLPSNRLWNSVLQCPAMSRVLEIPPKQQSPYSFSSGLQSATCPNPSLHHHSSTNSPQPTINSQLCLVF